MAHRSSKTHTKHYTHQTHQTPNTPQTHQTQQTQTKHTPNTSTTILTGMEPERGLAVGGLDVALGGVLRHAQDAVQVLALAALQLHFRL